MCSLLVSDLIQRMPFLTPTEWPIPKRLFLNTEIKTRVYGKWQTSYCRLRYFQINDMYTKTVQNNSHV